MVDGVPRLLGGRYEVGGLLGRGGMAEVHIGHDTRLHRTVAIKVLRSDLARDPTFQARFKREAQSAAALNHPAIVAVYDTGEDIVTSLSGVDTRIPYIVMEYVEGHTVFDDLEERGRYEESRALEIVIQIARALEHAHKAGFIHRDVKPKNIMITTDGTAKLADMGLARAVSDREAAEAEQGKAYGTPYYISPEQIRGELDVDFRCDIYGLGATFYHMVTGQVPFEGANPSAVMHKHLKSELVPPDHINPNLSAGIGEIIEVCMAKDRNSRYASTTDLLADLEAVARGEAPMQARKHVDIGKLAALEASADSPDPAATVDLNGTSPLLEQPIFWIAVAGWVVALLLLVLLLAL